MVQGNQTTESELAWPFWSTVDDLIAEAETKFEYKHKVQPHKNPHLVRYEYKWGKHQDHTQGQVSTSSDQDVITGAGDKMLKIADQTSASSGSADALVKIKNPNFQELL